MMDAQWIWILNISTFLKVKPLEQGVMKLYIKMKEQGLAEVSDAEHLVQY